MWKWLLTRLNSSPKEECVAACYQHADSNLQDLLSEIGQLRYEVRRFKRLSYQLIEAQPVKHSKE